MRADLHVVRVLSLAEGLRIVHGLGRGREQYAQRWRRSAHHCNELLDLSQRWITEYPDTARNTTIFLVPAGTQHEQY
jgi:hypothetical protein